MVRVLIFWELIYVAVSKKSYFSADLIEFAAYMDKVSPILNEYSYNLLNNDFGVFGTDEKGVNQFSSSGVFSITVD